MNSQTNKTKRKCRMLEFTPLDIFGSPVEFNINGQNNYKTVVGFCWTIVMFLLMIAAAVYYMMILIDKSNVTMSG